MTDNRPDLNTTEVRQGDSRTTNARALTFGIIGAIIVLGLAIWYFVANQEDTATTSPTTLEEVPVAPDEVDTDLDALPTPAPVVPDETPAEAPVVDTAPVVPETETAPVIDTPVETDPAPAAETPDETEPAPVVP